MEKTGSGRCTLVRYSEGGVTINSTVSITGVPKFTPFLSEVDNYSLTFQDLLIHRCLYTRPVKVLYVGRRVTLLTFVTETTG